MLSNIAIYREEFLHLFDFNIQ